MRAASCFETAAVGRRRRACAARWPPPQHEAGRGPPLLHQEKEPPSRHAAGEAFPDLGLGQLAADEDDAAFALLARLPRALVVAVENHVHALKHEALVVVLERQDALAAQNARPLGLHEVLHPGKELVRVERLVGLERDRLHLFVMIVLQAAVVTVVVAVIMAVVMVMAVVVVMIVIVMMVTAVAKEFRLDLHDAVEIESI